MPDRAPHKADKFYVWRRRSLNPRLDDYVSCTQYRPDDTTTCTFDVLLETPDWPEAHHFIAAERYGDDVEAHKHTGCPVCWGDNPDTPAIRRETAAAF